MNQRSPYDQTPCTKYCAFEPTNINAFQKDHISLDVDVVETFPVPHHLFEWFMPVVVSRELMTYRKTNFPQKSSVSGLVYR